MNELTQKIVTFCTDETQKTFDLAENCPLIISKNCLVKIPLTKTLVGLLLMHKNELNMLLHDCGIRQTEVVGFYSATTKLLYMKNAVEYSIELKWQNRERPKFPIEYRPLPCSEMLNALAERLTWKLMPNTPCQPLDIYDINQIRPIANAFFGNIREKACISGEYFSSYASKKIERQILRNQDIELYLNAPDAWFAYAEDVVMKDADTVEDIRKRIHRGCVVNVTLRAIQNDPNHNWHKQMKLMEAVAGKKVVTIKTKDATFKYKTDGLTSVDGEYGIFFIDFSSKDMKAYRYSDFSSFSINDIEQVLYRGKVIYKAQPEPPTAQTVEVCQNG